ncbi:MAG: S9 family peptidase [Gemmatales bacterium]|nr:S9 family peptidase [Gemmatales bacterium]MDW8387167.1 S9 family peptidase [Gemmatales bacterium]
MQRAWFWRIGLAICLAVGVSAAHAEETKRLMTVEDLWAVKRVGSPTISPDGKWAAVEVSSYTLDSDDHTSDIWLLACDGSRQVQLTTYRGKNSGPKWSPDGRHIAFVSKRDGDEVPQIYVIAPDGGEARRLTKMPMAPAHLKWSADSKTIFCIAWTWPDADDETHVKKEKEWKESKSKAFIIDDATYRYWDKWIADGKRPLVFAVDVATGKHRNLLHGTGLTLPPYEPSANDYDVSPDGSELAFVADSVKEIGLDVNYDIYALDLKSGKVRNLTDDNPANDTSPVYSPDGKHLAFLRQTIKFFYADRTRLMVLDRQSGQKTELTKDLDRSCGNPRWLPDSRRVAVEVEDQGYMNLFLVSVDPPAVKPHYAGISERSVDFAAKADVAVFLRTSFDLPATVFAGNFEERRPIQIDRFNDKLAGSWKLGKVESVVISGADDRPVQMWIVYPPDFDPNKKWPLVQVVHGGPHNGIYSDFSFRWNPQLWAAQGWVIGIVNFHGSSGFGQDFTDSITGDLGTKPMIDILKATDWFEQHPWIDRNRMAAAGASYGGYMMAWLNGHTDRFKAMVCHAGVYNWHSMMASDLIRGRERALGAKPWGGDLEKIDRQNAQRLAANFKTPTLVLHGEKDYRVPVTQGMEYYNTLRQKGVPTRFVYFPDENHWILKAPNSVVWHREVFGWLKKYIGSGPTR